MPSLRGADLVLSAPFDSSGFESTFVSAYERSRPSYLFGFESQINALIAAARCDGVSVLQCAAPEIFSNAEATLRQLEKFGLTGNRYVHLRLGAARYARILRGVENIFLAIEGVRQVAGGIGNNPYAANDCLPPGFTGLVAYQGTHDLPSRLGGMPLPVSQCAKGLARADLALPGTTTGTQADDLHGAVSFAELDSSLTAKAIAQGRWRPDDVHVEASLRSVLLLPWNLANPVSLTPSIARLLARHKLPVVGDLDLVICPFNVAWCHGRDILDLISDVKKLLGTAALLERFKLMLPTSQALANMRRSQHVSAWLDGQDPDLEWSLERCTYLGIDAAVIEAPSRDHPTSDRHRTMRGIVRSNQAVRDEFGKRSYTVSIPSAAQLAIWLEAEVARCVVEIAEPTDAAIRSVEQADLPATLGS